MSDLDCPPDGVFYGAERGDCVKVIDLDGNEFRGVIQQFSLNVIWIAGGDLYWANTGEWIGHDARTCEDCLKGKPQTAFPRIELATLDELDPLLDVSFLQ